MVNIHQVNENMAQASQRIELKFFVLPWNIDIAYALLRQFCRLDIEYPKEQINSLYFDTEDLEQYEKSAEGELLKNKVRIRWYHRLDDYQETVPVFLELKQREGFTGSKRRRRLTVPVHSLEPTNLYRGIIPDNTIMNTLAGFGYFPEVPIQPVVFISYWRHRFTELLTGMRVNLDCNIRSTMVNRPLGFGESELKLAGGVIEVKGSKMELPETLCRLKLLDLDWSRFSKYSSCLDSHLSAPGDMARLWHFTLITGTNRNKTLEEIISDEDFISEAGWVRIHVIGVDAIKTVLNKLPQNEFILWLASMREQTEQTDINIQLPPGQILDTIKEHAEQCGLDFQIQPLS